MAIKKPDPIKTVKPAVKPTALNTVTINSTRLAKPSTTTPMYPQGKISNTTVDSIKKANPVLGKAIGNPVQNGTAGKTYGTASSDLIKQAIKPKKK